MQFRVIYLDPAELLADRDQQLSRGGFLVRVDPPPGLELYTDAALVLECMGEEVRLEGRVLQVLPGVGVAVSAVPGPELDGLADRAAALGGRPGAPAEHRIDTPSHTPPQARPEAAQDVHARVRAAGRTERIRMARYGGRDERMLLMRGTDPVIHRFVLGNPGLGLEEVRAIAAMTHVTADVLKTIVERAEFSHRPDVALALVRNPKTPVPLAIQMLAHVGMSDLRQLARSSALRMPVLQAVRKRVVAP